MKRATTITLLCMGVGAVFVAHAYESRCRVDEQKDAADWTDAASAKPPPTDTSCRSSSGYSHSYYSHSYSHSSGGYGFSSSGVSRGGFGGSGHSSAS